MAGRGQVSWLPGSVCRAFPGGLASPVAGSALRRLKPGHSGGTAPVLHRTSLDHRPYLRRVWFKRRPGLGRIAVALGVAAYPPAGFFAFIAGAI
jgi:hypothetical protein